MGWKLLVAEDDMPQLVEALWLDDVPAVLMERTGTGWRIEYLQPAKSPAVAALIAAGVVRQAP